MHYRIIFDLKDKNKYLIKFITKLSLYFCQMKFVWNIYSYTGLNQLQNIKKKNIFYKY